ncbi:hypothetical protein BC835DRAFT_1411009 [Cytidiella melzeri]|nr:hypothetical protein BC835DRAFT_1411009 [Cytidiella melzeri]
MRSPVIAFGILAATVSPGLIAAAPTSPNLPGVAAVSAPASGAAASAPNGIPHAPAGSPLGFFSGLGQHRKRADDANTAGGNARTGNSNTASGGSVVNNADPATTLTNDDANFGGDANDSITGEADGGEGEGRGPGGNAYTGNSGPARGGSIYNSAGTVENTDGANTPGSGGTSGTGDAFAGDARRKRALNSQTAGGNAQSGDSSSTSTGSVFNEAEDDGEVTNNASNDFGTGEEDGVTPGESYTGNAVGGNGNNRGPGGNAASGTAGSSNGGNIGNEGGTVDNTDSNDAADGGVSTSGNAIGGDVAKRAFDAETAGGNAHTGDSSDVNGGSVANVADDNGAIDNTDSSFGGMGGTTTTGDAEGGNSNGRGPGGNASTGNSGNARGGAVSNDGGDITNMGGSDLAGDGGSSTTGTAVGGNVDGSRGDVGNDDNGFNFGGDDEDINGIDN